MSEVVLNWNADDLLLCPNEGPIEFGASPSGGSWSAPVMPSGVLDPTGLATGPYAVVYTWTAPNCTLQNMALEVEVLPLSEVMIDPVPLLCADGQPHLLTANLSGTWSGAVSGTGSSIWLDPSLLGAGTWTVQLLAEEPGACPAVATVDVVVDLCSGIAPGPAAFQVGVSPNPADGVTWMNVPAGTMGTVEVLDATGRPVLTRRIAGDGTPQALDLGTCAAGSYLLRITSSDGRIGQVRVVKQ